MNQLTPPEDLGLEHSFLIFEDDGQADSLSALELKKCLQQRPDSLPRLELVLLMACHSEVIGNVFQENCANHVICVNKGKAVLDEASIEFTTNLY